MALNPLELDLHVVVSCELLDVDAGKGTQGLCSVLDC